MGANPIGSKPSQPTRSESYGFHGDVGSEAWTARIQAARESAPKATIVVEADVVLQAEGRIGMADKARP